MNRMENEQIEFVECVIISIVSHFVISMATTQCDSFMSRRKRTFANELSLSLRNYELVRDELSDAPKVDAVDLE